MMDKNRISLVLGLVAAIAIIGWTMYATDIEQEKKFDSDNYIYDSKEHRAEIVQKCFLQKPMETKDYENKLSNCLEENGIIQK